MITFSGFFGKEGEIMGFSNFLNSRRDRAKLLVKILKDQFDYVSILGADNTSTAIRVDANTGNIRMGKIQNVVLS